MTLADGTDINVGDGVLVSEEALDMSDIADGLEGRQGVVTDIDEDDGLITVELNGNEVTLSPAALEAAGAVVRTR